MKPLITKKYPIYFDADCYSALNAYFSENDFSKIFILTDSNTERFCLPEFLPNLKTEIPLQTISFPSGEKNKSLATSEIIWKFLSENQADRKALFISLGGGVVTDLGGFVASTYQRGIRFIHVPTSLLGMVDAAIGGKNGVNLDYLKNQIGVIVPPAMVLADFNFLKTLPEEQFRSGIAEMLKHALISSGSHWKELSSGNMNIINVRATQIRQSIKIKTEITEKDPGERGLRKTLNFGHTLGHAIESYFLSFPDRKSLLHGEAIAVGMILAGFLSKELTDFPERRLKEMITVFRQYFDYVNFEKEDVQGIIRLLRYDKKNEKGNINFVLLKDIGNPKLDCQVPNALIFKAFQYYEDSE